MLQRGSSFALWFNSLPKERRMKVITRLECEIVALKKQLEADIDEAQKGEEE